MPDETMLLPLNGIRVIELADARAEFVGRLLSNLGADVIKVEPPNGASSRSIGPYKDGSKHTEQSLFWWHFNLGKRSVTIDLSTTEGKALLKTLLGPTDVLIESLGVDGLAKVGLGDWSTIHQRNPSLVVLSVSDFGLDGPWSSYQISELVAMALGGQMMTAGYAPLGDGTYDAPPMTPQMHQPINILGCLGTMDILAALAQRDMTGDGQRIDLSVHAAVNGASENHLSWYIAAGVIAKRKPQFPLHQAKDGIYVQVMPSLFGEEWGRLAKFLDHYGMADDLLEPEYASREHRARPEVQAHIDNVLSSFIASRDADDIFHAAQKAGVVWSPIRLPHQNVDDPHIIERGGFTKVAHPEAGVTVTMAHAPWVSDHLGWRTGPRAPLLGEHTTTVLAEVGLSHKDISALQNGNVI